VYDARISTTYGKKEKEFREERPTGAYLKSKWRICFRDRRFAFEAWSFVTEARKREVDCGGIIRTLLIKLKGMGRLTGPPYSESDRTGKDGEES